MHLLSLVGIFGGDIFNGGSTALGLPGQFLHNEHVDDRVEARAGSHGELHRHHLRSIDVAHIREYQVEVAVVLIQLVQQENHWFLQFLCVAEGIHRAHLGAVSTIDKNDSLIGDVQCSDSTAYEVVRTRAVNNIQLFAVPLGVENSGEYRIAILLFHREIVTHRVLLLHSATALDYTTLKKHCLGKSSLAGTRTANQRDVLDFVRLINFHFLFWFLGYLSFLSFQPSKLHNFGETAKSFSENIRSIMTF